MVKTIKLGEKEITLSNNLAWATIYKDQFGKDIVPAVMPVLSAILQLVGKLEGADTVEVIKALDEETIADALNEFDAFKFTDLLNLTWALNKAYDDEVEDPKKWVRQFDEFPLDVVVPAIIELLAKGLVSSKNLQSLQGMIPKKASV